MNIMHPEIENAHREIIEAFNAKPKIGIQKIKDICEEHGITSVEKEIADFFHQQKQNLDLEAVGDYLSGPDDEHQKVLEFFTAQMDFKDKIFTDGLRSFLRAFKLPGEAQKIDRLVENFGKEYCKQNPGGAIANDAAAYVLAYQVIMLNTSLHNPNIKPQDKMSLDAVKRNLRGLNNEEDFDKEFVEEIYNDIKSKPFELNFVKTNPGYELTSRALNHDPTLRALDNLLQSSNVKPQTIFPDISDNITATVDQPKSWLNFFTGYEGTITLKNETTDEKLATIQVYKPGFFARWLFGEQPKVRIQPGYQAGNAQEPINLAAKIAASFKSPVTSIKATYNYVKSDLEKAYKEQKSLTAKSSSNKEEVSANSLFSQTTTSETMTEPNGDKDTSIKP